MLDHSQVVAKDMSLLCLLDVDPELLDYAMTAIAHNLGRQIIRGTVTIEDRVAILTRIYPRTEECSAG